MEKKTSLACACVAVISVSIKPCDWGKNKRRARALGKEEWKVGGVGRGFLSLPALPRSVYLFIYSRLALRKWATTATQTKSSFALVNLPYSLKSSTRIISARRCGGERLRTLCTVLSNTDNASLWKQTITLVVGSLVGYVLCFSRHLRIN